MRRSIATPCPVSVQQFSAHEFYTKDDTTTNFEFTTAFSSTLHSARPRRVGAARKTPTNFIIHEDQSQGEKTNERASSITAQPPKRSNRPSLSLRVAEHNQHESHSSMHSRSHGTTSITGPPSQFRPSIPMVPELEQDEKPETHGHADHITSRPLRRGTLYIPSDDTTQPSMWMGLFSPLKEAVDGSDNTSLQTQSVQVTGIAAQMAAKRRRRSSMLAVAPKRAPLQVSSSVPQETFNNNAHSGPPTGKENVAPGCLLIQGIRSPDRRPFQTNVSENTCSIKVTAQAQAKSTSRKSINVVTSRSSMKHERVPHSSAIDMQSLEESAVKSRFHQNNPGSRAKPQLREKQIMPTVPSRFVHSSQKQAPSITLQMPLLEDLPNTAMYEDNWLGHHELVMTMLINQLLEEPKSSSSSCSTDTRHALLVKYNTEDMGFMHQRLKAACLHGPLSFTSEGVAHAHCLITDIGRRKAFIKYWLDNFDTDALGIALEVVLGRQLPSLSDQNDLGTISTYSAKRKTIVRVIEAFLVRLDDIADASKRHTDGPAKTLQRCCMVIKALDLLKQGDSPIFSSCLFRTTAWVKSSPGAIQAIVKMLNPSVGDCLRLLRQIGFEVSHAQCPTDEIVFKVENLAVDLRDGALLTRLVEVMLYSDQLYDQTIPKDFDHTTLSLPEGETVHVVHQDDRPLTRHLKYPCISRASRLWNVEIALGSLRQVESIARSIQGVSADDIVDGFREKTMQLLWMLISQWGMTALIDLADIKQEIRRLELQRSVPDRQLRHNILNEASQTKAEGLLKDWARAVASSQGLEVNNFTTGFSDGRIFESIVDEYNQYLSSDIPRAGISLQQKLLNLGCSKQFSELFMPDGSNQGHVFSTDFVRAALVYLCNRLLRPSKQCRAAIILQRTWRRHWQKVLHFRKQQLSKIARDCATIVLDRDLQSFDRDCAGAAQVDKDPASRLEAGSDIWLSL